MVGRLLAFWVPRIWQVGAWILIWWDAISYGKKHNNDLRRDYSF